MELELRFLLSFLLFECLTEKKTPSHMSPLEISLISQMFLRFFSLEKGLNLTKAVHKAKICKRLILE